MIDGRRRIVYAGPSMNPTLREPDLLWVEPYGNGPVQAGDVVCFKSPEEDVNIVHRGVSVGPRSPVSGRLLDGGPKDGIRTRGDNNPQPDLWAIGVDHLLGRVVTAQRGSRRRPVPGGRTGRMVAGSVRLRKTIWGVVAGIASLSYHGLIRCGPFDFLLPGDLRPRLICFNGREAATLKLLIGKRAIGRYDRAHKEWQIRRPFRLFVDVQTLLRPKFEVRSSKSEVPSPQSPIPSPKSQIPGPK